MIKIHVIFNAHIDPIWLWPWQAGLDVILATCRSACERLENHKDLQFTRGEAWVYEQIERLDPRLFKRITKHIESGQWQIVGGWYIQPDCNLPSAFAMEKQIAIGKKYFLDKFGFFPKTAYNVDSFGHASALPGLMRDAGQENYVMMRPQEHEMHLPARMFRWRGYENGPEVTTFRIARSYNTGNVTEDHLRAALHQLPEGIEHTISFLGWGDHGGGPTEFQIAQVRELQKKMTDVKLVFSSPQKFFDAIASQKKKLPLVVGELQMHAVGCFSVYRPIKTGVRKTEHLLAQAEIATKQDPHPEPGTRDRLDEAWKKLVFHHFHDTLGGTCIPSAYPAIEAQLGMSRAICDEIIQFGLRRQMAELPDDPRQRIVLFNPSDEAFDGYTSLEAWVNSRWLASWRIVDEKNRQVPYQREDPECIAPFLNRVLFPVKLAAGELRTLRIEPNEKAKVKPAAEKWGLVECAYDRIASDTGAAVDWAKEELRFGKVTLRIPRLQLLDDLTDTWSHNIDRYAEGPGVAAVWDAPSLYDAGPLMASLVQTGQIGRSDLIAEWRVYAGQRYVELRLRVNWMEKYKVLKLVLPTPGQLQDRLDGVMGGELSRPPSGKELPLRDRTLLAFKTGEKIGVVCPDVFAIDGLPARVRFTLLRSCLMAHHFPNQPTHAARSVPVDQGLNEFRFRFFGGPGLTGNLLDRSALIYQRPLINADYTRGMPAVL